MAAALTTAAMDGKRGNDGVGGPARGGHESAASSHPLIGAPAVPDARPGARAPAVCVNEPADAVDLLDSFQTALSALHEKSIRVASMAKRAGRTSSNDARGAAPAASSSKTTVLLVENPEAASTGPADLPSQECRGEEATVMASHGTVEGVSTSAAAGEAAADAGASAAACAQAADEQLVVIVRNCVSHCDCGGGDVVHTRAGRNLDGARRAAVGLASVPEISVSDAPSSDLREELQSVLRTRRTSLSRRTPWPRPSPPSTLAAYQDASNSADVVVHPEPNGWSGLPVMRLMQALVVGAVLVKFGLSTLRDR